MARDFAKRLYKSKAWKDCRDSYYISQHGICERCGAGGKIVHHKIELNSQNINDPAVTLNWEVLELTCQECHNQEHFACDAVVDGLAFDANGNLVQR